MHPFQIPPELTPYQRLLALGRQQQHRLLPPAPQILLQCAQHHHVHLADALEQAHDNGLQNTDFPTAILLPDSDPVTDDQEKSGDVGLAMLKNFCDWKI